MNGFLSDYVFFLTVIKLQLIRNNILDYFQVPRIWFEHLKEIEKTEMNKVVFEPD